VHTETDMRHDTPTIEYAASLAEHRRDRRQVFLQLRVAWVEGERAHVVHLGVLVARQLAECHAAARQELEREGLRVARGGGERGERGARVVEAGVEGMQLEVARRAVGEALAAEEEPAHLARVRVRVRVGARVRVRRRSPPTAAPSIHSAAESALSALP
jgi:hypothetical protein